MIQHDSDYEILDYNTDSGYYTTVTLNTKVLWKMKSQIKLNRSKLI